jgi:hypothetical protein
MSRPGPAGLRKRPERPEPPRGACQARAEVTSTATRLCASEGLCDVPSVPVERDRACRGGLVRRHPWSRPDAARERKAREGSRRPSPVRSRRHGVAPRPARRRHHRQPGNRDRRSAAASADLSHRPALRDDSGPRRDGALGREQGQRVPAPRLRPRSRNRLRQLRRRHAGEPGDQRPRPGIFGPELPDPPDRQQPGLHQGALLRPERRLQRRRLSAGSSDRRSAKSGLPQRRDPARRRGLRRRDAPLRQRRPDLGRAAGRPHRRAVGSAKQLQQGQCGRAVQPRPSST